MPVVSKTNIKEYKDSFSNEKFDFRNHPNITFFVYVSNFTWPIKIQVRTAFELRCMNLVKTKFTLLESVATKWYHDDLPLRVLGIRLSSTWILF